MTKIPFGLRGLEVLVLGAGDLASGVIRRLHIAGARVVATELPSPLTVRRQVSFSEAVHRGSMEVEGVTAALCVPGGIDEVLAAGKVALVVDPEASFRRAGRFQVLVDARMAKVNLGTRIDDAPAVIALGPGFTAGRDCHAVIETLQGAGMGRAIFEGSACGDTGEPCSLNLPGGIPSGAPAESRVLRAPCDGVMREIISLGERVEAGQTVAEVGGMPLVSPLEGVLRGMVAEGTLVTRGLKIGEVDLTGKASRVFRVSEKANAVAGGVLEAVFRIFSVREAAGDNL